MNQTKKYRIQKLDRRMTGHQIFSHRIRVYWNEDFLKIRDWVIKMFGPACELELFELSQHIGLGYTWAYDTRDYNRNIYLNQEQLSAFILFNS